MIFRVLFIVTIMNHSRYHHHHRRRRQSFHDNIHLKMNQITNSKTISGVVLMAVLYAKLYNKDSKSNEIREAVCFTRWSHHNATG